MIVDNNLNDITHEYIKNIRCEYLSHISNLRKITNISCIVSILLCINVIILCIQNIRLSNNNSELESQLENQIEEEIELSLERSIGYWFINTPEEVNDSILYQFLVKNNAWYPDILLKQAKIESGNYTSNVYKNSNNLYGMKKVGKRQTTQLNNTYNGYGCYNNWCLSVLDRMLWDVFMFNNVKPTKEEYLNAISMYAEDSQYLQKIK